MGKSCLATVMLACHCAENLGFATLGVKCPEEDHNVTVKKLDVSYTTLECMSTNDM